MHYNHPPWSEKIFKLTSLEMAKNALQSSMGFSGHFPKNQGNSRFSRSPFQMQGFSRFSRSGSNPDISHEEVWCLQLGA